MFYALAFLAALILCLLLISPDAPPKTASRITAETLER